MKVCRRPWSSWWQWPTVLSLDAPLVVVGWQAVLAHVARVQLGWPHAVVLALSTWLAYAADRWIEGWRLPAAAIQTERHAFYQRRRWTMFTVWIVVLAADLRVALTRLAPAEFEAGWLVVPPILAYLLSHQLVHRDHPWRAPKEACVALLLGAGVALFPLAQPDPYYRALWPTLVLFVLLCFANCTLISLWEHDVDRRHRQTSLALQSGSPGWIHRLPWTLVALSILFGLFERGNARVAAVCAAGSATLLIVVDSLHPRLGRRLARVLADVALLTPFAAMALGYFS